MSEIICVQSDLDVLGNFSFGQFTDFPPNPRIGSAVIVNRILHVYMEMGGVQSWYPLTQHTSSYIHTQGVPSQTWTVSHNLGTSNLWTQVKDNTGNILIVNKQDVDLNTFTLHFTTPTIGTCVVAAPEAVNVPTVKATVFEIGSGEVVLDSSGVRVNGDYLATTLALQSKADLVGGKVPVAQLPDLASTEALQSKADLVGGKVPVAQLPDLTTKADLVGGRVPLNQLPTDLNYISQLWPNIPFFSRSKGIASIDVQISVDSGFVLSVTLRNGTALLLKLDFNINRENVVNTLGLVFTGLPARVLFFKTTRQVAYLLAQQTGTDYKINYWRRNGISQPITLTYTG